MESFLNYKIEQFVVESHDGKTSTDLTQCIASVKYYEDLFSPATFISLLLVNTNGLLSSLGNTDSSKQSGIKGGERVRLKINQPAFPKNKIDIDETKDAYYIYKVSLSTTEYTREAMLVELCPAEVFINETARVQKRCKGNIGNTVKEILTENLKIPKEKLQGNIESTVNDYIFYGNNKRPFTVITWLCPKSIPGNRSKPTSSSPNAGTAGFLFYQNRNGFNFKSMDSLMSGLKLSTTDKRNIQTYYYGTPPNPASDIQNRLIVDTPTFEKNVNVMENLRIGMYASKNYFFDINARKFYPYDYSLKESYKLMSHASGANVPPPIPLGLEKSPSRLMIRVLDNFSADPANPKDTTPAINNEDKTPLYQAASIARYNLAFSQSLNITVPLNLSLTVGDIINLQFPKITTGTRGEKDDIKSGHYLIKEVAHLFESNQGYTGLKLIRDSYGAPA